MERGTSPTAFARPVGRYCRPPTHPALHAPHQWQSRAVHSDGLARMGLRPAVLHLGAARRDPPRLARPLQLRPTTWQPRRAASSESSPRGEQPHARSQLDRERSSASNEEIASVHAGGTLLARHSRMARFPRGLAPFYPSRAAGKTSLHSMTGAGVSREKVVSNKQQLEHHTRGGSYDAPLV